MADGSPALDVVQHPTLGELKFPHDMPFDERNKSIERLENQSDPSRTLSLVSPAGRTQSLPPELRSTEKPVWDAPDTGEAKAPGSTQPLRQEQSLASNLANLASLPMSGESPMGMPEAPSVGELWSGAKTVASKAMREPGRFTADPTMPPTRGALKPWAKAGVGPVNISKVADILAPAREPIVQPISHSPNYGLIRAAARQVGRAPVEPEVQPEPMFSGISSSPASVAHIGEAQLPQIDVGAETANNGPESNIKFVSEFEKPKPPAAEEGIKGSTAKASGRLVLTPEEIATENRKLAIAAKRAHDNGMMYAGGMRPAGGGRVPATPITTETFEYPGAREVSHFGNEPEVEPETPPRGPSEPQGGVVDEYRLNTSVRKLQAMDNEFERLKRTGQAISPKDLIARDTLAEQIKAMRNGGGH